MTMTIVCSWFGVYSDSVAMGDKQYFLFTRTKGWHDKVVFFELYEGKPEFDQCEKASFQALYTVDYDDYPEKKYVKALLLQPGQAEKLKITYTQNVEEGVANVYDVKFTQ